MTTWQAWLSYETTLFWSKTICLCIHNLVCQTSWKHNMCTSGMADSLPAATSACLALALVQNLHVLFVAPCRALLDSMSKRNWWTGAPIIRSSSSPTRYRPVWTAKYAPLGLSKFEGELAQTFGQIKCIQMQVPNAGICLKMLLVNKQQHVNARSNLFH